MTSQFANPHPPRAPPCSKFEADGMLNPTFETGSFELPVQQISGAAPGYAPHLHAGSEFWLQLACLGPVHTFDTEANP